MAVTADVAETAEVLLAESDFAEAVKLANGMMAVVNRRKQMSIATLHVALALVVGGAARHTRAQWNAEAERRGMEAPDPYDALIELAKWHEGKRKA